MTHPAEKYIDKLTAIMARRDAKISEQQDTIATLRATVADLMADMGLQKIEVDSLICENERLRREAMHQKARADTLRLAIEKEGSDEMPTL